MRKWLSALVVGLGVLGGYALRAGAAQAESGWLPFTAGEIVVLVTDSGRLETRCTVTQTVHEFLGCKADRSETWYNLRLVEAIRRP